MLVSAHTEQLKLCMRFETELHRIGCMWKIPVHIYIHSLSILYKINSSDVVLTSTQKLVTLFEDVSHEAFASHWDLVA